ncbi:AAA family ATPase [Sutcliffiella sp. FSL R7-0096]|uniref:AAA family ATPase n=1 Tax=Sutcliffiella sp. FSL R7-0096 TaxID=2921670 RepID=UPI00315AA6F5
MKNITLHRLELRNFKGVKSFALEVHGENVKVYGDNATGKTTLFDAFVWLLFDKDSQNKEKFSIKTLNKGKELHGLEHEVEATFTIGDQKVTLRKVFSEKWTKKRGSAEKKFSGHTTDYYVDDVPSKKKDFTDQVESIVDEKIFKLLTSPSYFNDQLHWKDRRNILLEVCGDVTEEDVIASNKELAQLPAILKGRTIEKHRAAILGRRTEINKELDKIPVRIDEIEHNLPSVEGLEKIVLEGQVESITSQIDEKQDIISNIRNGNAISSKQREIQEIELELLKIRQQHEAGSKDDFYKLKAQIQEEKSAISLLESKQSNLRQKKKFNDDSIASTEKKLQQLRKEWMELDVKEFVHNDECECPTCGQDLPEEQVSATREKALAQFNLQKSKQLEEVDTSGKRIKAQKESLLSENEQLTKEYESISSLISEKEENLLQMNEQLKLLEGSVVDIMDNQSYATKLKEKLDRTSELDRIRLDAQTSIREVEKEVQSLKEQRLSIQSDLAKFVSVDQAKKRIDELMEQERLLATEFEKLEQELYLTEEFTRSKVNLLEEKINSKFKYARFNLFKTNINGGLEDICDTTYEGVPYSSGLNNAARINVGLDIINTLSEHYGVSAPIFVDNSEAVTRLIDVGSQVIQLVVSEQDKVLRVEYPEHREAI